MLLHGASAAAQSLPSQPRVAVASLAPALRPFFSGIHLVSGAAGKTLDSVQVAEAGSAACVLNDGGRRRLRQTGGDETRIKVRREIAQRLAQSAGGGDNRDRIGA